jgi:APA family basic amino acid/polyamine antiporter
VAIVVGTMVGTGVFGALGFQVQEFPSGFLVVLLWLTGGIIAFCGAVNYAELAAAFPRSGGEYQLLSRIYHPGIGFMSGWISLTVGFPAPVALSALLAGHCACGVAGVESVLLAQLIAAGLVVMITGAHLISVGFSGKFQGLSTLLKVLLLAGLTVCGFWLPEGQPVNFLPQAGDGAMLAGNVNGFFSALIWVLFAYSGWNAACYISGEVENPQRNVPRALLFGTLLVMILYIGINAAMLYAAPIPALAARPESMAVTVAAHIFGPHGGTIVTGLIGLGLVSSISAMMWAGPRVLQEMGRDYPTLGFLARTSSGGVPWMAVLLQGALALLLIFTADVRSIVNRTEFLLQMVLLLTVWGVIHLRVRQPDLPRPCRAWGYPWTTILFLIMITFTLAWLLRERHEATRWGMGIMITGLAFYFLLRNERRTTA